MSKGRRTYDIADIDLLRSFMIDLRSRSSLMRCRLVGLED